jgi:hypothetical protein
MTGEVPLLVFSAAMMEAYHFMQEGQGMQCNEVRFTISRA